MAFVLVCQQLHRACPCLRGFLLALAVLLSLSCCCTAHSSTLPSVTHVRAIYPVQVTQNGTALVSSEYTLCSRFTHATSVSTDSAAAADNYVLSAPTMDLSEYCSESTVPLQVRQSIAWSTMAPPGVYPDHSNIYSNETIASLELGCAMFACNMESQLDATIAKAILVGTANAEGKPPELAPAVGGLSPSTPCCGTINSTFILYTASSRRFLVQTQSLPVVAIAAEAKALMEEEYRSFHEESKSGSSSNSSSSSSTSTSSASNSLVGVDSGGVVQASSCLIRLLDIRLYSNVALWSDGWRGDGGLVFPVRLSICGRSISEVMGKVTARTVQSEQTAIISTTELAEGLGLPFEIIKSILAWTRATRGGPSLASDKGRCVWHSESSVTGRGFYRTGEYVQCTLDSGLIGLLPPVTVSVPRGRLVSAIRRAASNVKEEEGAAIPASNCTFVLDLNRLVSKDGVLTLHSTGSISESYASTSPVVFREPLVVIGALFLRGATIATTRAAYVEDGNVQPADTIHLWHGLPMLYLAAPMSLPLYSSPLAVSRETDVNSANGLPDVCAAAAQCAPSELYFRSFNKCGLTQCAHVLGYLFDVDDLSCKPNPNVFGTFAGLFVLVVTAEVVVLYMRRRAERSRGKHMALIDQVQRKAQ